MLTLCYFLAQDAEAMFDTVAGLNDSGVIGSFDLALRRIREHAVAALREAEGGDHAALCYHFHAAASLLMATLDGLAVYVEKKVQDPPTKGIVYWHSAFVDPRFRALRAIRDRTNAYIIKGGIDARALRNFAKHYLPWVHLAAIDPTSGKYDIMFPTGGATPAGLPERSGPVLRGLLVPLFNDACAAVRELGALIDQPVPCVHEL